MYCRFNTSKVLNRTVGFEGTEWSVSHKNKEVTLKQQGGESTTVIKSKYVRKFCYTMRYNYLCTLDSACMYIHMCI